MTDYMLLIHEPVGQRAGRTPAEGADARAQMLAFGDALEREGRLKARASLAGLHAATRVSAAGVQDGPFAEAKEMVGGFFLLQCESRAQALAIARRCPAAAWSTVELRELAPCNAESLAGTAADGVAGSLTASLTDSLAGPR